MTYPPDTARWLALLAALTALNLPLALPVGLSAGLVAAAHAQDDDGGGDDGGGGDDDGGRGDDDDDRATDRGDRGQAPRTVRARQGGAAQPATRPARAATVPEPAQFAAGEIVVSGLTTVDLSALVAEGFAVIEALQIVRNGPVLHRLRIPDGLAIDAARDRVRARESGRNADFNHFYRSGQDLRPAAAFSAVPAAAPAPAAPCTHLNCAALDLIAWPADRAPSCRATVDIGVIDTGVNLDHPGLAAAGVDLTRLLPEDLPASGETHGTAVVSMLVGTEARAPGVLREARIVAVDIFSRDGGDERADVAHLVAALDLLAQRGVRVANLSLAGPENTVLGEMLRAVAEGGMLVVAAAGNGGPAAAPAWPAAADTVLAVTAVDGGGRIYRRAQRGAHVDVAAPGVDVWSSASVRGVKPRTGTSYAAPFATAAAAVLLSRHPDMTPADAISAMRSLTRDTGQAGPDDVYGAGILLLDGLCTAAFAAPQPVPMP